MSSLAPPLSDRAADGGAYGSASASSAVLARLRTVSAHHAAVLASRCTVAAAASDGTRVRRRRGRGEGPQVLHPLATVARRRSLCPQPPMGDGGGPGGASAASLVVEIDLTPPERVPPHLIVPGLRAADPAADPAVPLSPTPGTALGGEGESSPAGQATLRAVAALAALCDEAAELQILADRRVLPPLALFGSDLRRDGGVAANAALVDGEASDLRDAELLRRVGKFVPRLQEAFNFTLRCRRLVRNLVCQIGGCAVPAADGSGAVLGPDVRLVPAAEAAARLLGVLIAVDAVVTGNSCLAEGWDLYKAVMRDRALRQLQADGEGRGSGGGGGERLALEAFERLLVQLDFALVAGRSFSAAVEQNFDPGSHYRVDPDAPDGGGRFTLFEEVRALVSVLYDRCCSRIGTERESDDDRGLAIGTYGLYCLYRRILPTHLVPDAKLHRSLWMDLPDRFPFLALPGGGAAFVPRDFLVRYAPYEGLRGCSPPPDRPAEIRAAAVERVAADTAGLAAATDGLRSEAVRWMAEAEANLAPLPPAVAGPGASLARREEPALAVEKAAELVGRGVRLALRSTALLRHHLVSLSALDLTVDSANLPHLLALCEIAKSVEGLLRVRRRSSVISVQRAAVRILAASIYRRFEPLRLATDHYHASIDRGETSTSSSNNVARITACLSALEGILKGSSTFTLARRSVIAVAMTACVNADPDLLDETRRTLEDLTVLSDIDTSLRLSCDLSFLYFRRGIFADLCRWLFRNGGREEIQSLQLVCSAFSDADDELIRLSPPERRDGVLAAQSYRDFLVGYIQDGIIAPLCQAIDSELRLAVLDEVKQRNPKQDNRNARVRHFLELPCLCICGSSVSIKNAAQEYLESIFYAMSLASLQDNRFYSKMRVVARQFGLNPIDDCLPSASVEHSSDVLHIMRKMGNIIKACNYDLGQQILIEKHPVNRANTIVAIKATDIAQSIQQHGLGVVGEAIDTAYILLWEKFESLSQLILGSDEFLSLLAKEARWYRDVKADCGGAYPYDRAVDFSEEVRELGDDAYAAPILDQLRILVTSVGNVLGFVRMMWSAEVEVRNISVFSVEDSSAGKTRPQVDNAASLLTEFLRHHRPPQCGSESYLRTTTKRFLDDMNAEGYDHMKNLVLSVPALCLCWMEAILRGREMMFKKNVTGDVYFVDDGFALGLAFVMMVCGQETAFDGLKWFASLGLRQSMEEGILTETKADQEEKERASQASQKSSIFSFARAAMPTEDESQNNAEQDEEKSALSLSWKRLQVRKREMKCLLASIHCSRALLR